MINFDEIVKEMARNERNKLREQEAIDKLKKKLVENEITNDIYQRLEEKEKQDSITECE